MPVTIGRRELIREMLFELVCLTEEDKEAESRRRNTGCNICSTSMESSSNCVSDTLRKQVNSRKMLFESMAWVKMENYNAVLYHT